MKKEKTDKHFIKKPVYEGGIKAMREFIRKNLQYPDKALKNKVEGTVHVKYTINYKGVVTDARVISGLGQGCDEEAIRLVKLFKFKTNKTRKVKVKFEKKIQIHFRLPKVEEKKPVKVQYNYVLGSKEKSNKPDQESGSGYHYTINF